ncbi:hypothetical protein ACQRAB_00920 [Megasphaera elsdenii]|uniref:hypothetical protein n=1 Tax=Megasphaera elsdenii TaxID=907 RepID=UPI003D0802D3
MNQSPLRIRNSRNDSSDGKTSDEPRHNQHLLSKEQKLHQGEHLLARHIIREKGEMDLTEKVGSYMTTSSKARDSATVATADPTKGTRKKAYKKTSFKKAEPL